MEKECYKILAQIENYLGYESIMKYSKLWVEVLKEKQRIIEYLE